MAEWTKSMGGYLAVFHAEKNGGEYQPDIVSIDAGLDYRIKIEWNAEVDGHKLEKHNTHYFMKLDGLNMLFKELSKEE